MNTKIVNELVNERRRQDRLHGEYNAKLNALSSRRLSIIMSELGEASQALDYLERYLDSTQDKNSDTFHTLKEAYRQEIISVAAFAVNILEAMDLESESL